MQEYSIRKITEIRPEFVEPLVKLIHKQYAKLGQPFRPVTAEKLQEIIEQEKSWIVVLFADEKIVGAAYCYAKEVGGRSFMRIEDFRIMEDYQKSGWGQKMFEYIELLARDLELTAVELETEATNQSARHIYEKNGLMDRHMIAYRKILKYY